MFIDITKEKDGIDTIKEIEIPKKVIAAIKEKGIELVIHTQDETFY
jgi:hypothetical protein